MPDSFAKVAVAVVLASAVAGLIGLGNFVFIVPILGAAFMLGVAFLGEGSAKPFVVFLAGLAVCAAAFVVGMAALLLFHFNISGM